MSNKTLRNQKLRRPGKRIKGFRPKKPKSTDNYYTTSARIGDFIVTRRYSDRSHLLCGERWDAIPGTNAWRASIFGTNAAFAEEFNAHQDFVQKADRSRGR